MALVDAGPIGWGSIKGEREGKWRPVRPSHSNAITVRRHLPGHATTPMCPW